MTQRGIGVAGASLLLWIAARTFGIPELQMAAVGCLVLFVAALLWRLGLPTRLTADRTVHPSTLWFDGSATVSITVRNLGRLTSPRTTLTDQAPATLTRSPSIQLAPVSPGARTTIHYELHGTQRGRFTLGPVAVRSHDPFGLLTRTRTLDSVAEVTVYPPIWRLPPGLPLGGATSSGGTGRPRLAGRGDDLADLREYMRGDDLRSVHWPSTAHRGKLMVRRSESTRSPGAVVLLDRRADRHRGNGPTSSFETAIAAAASAGHHLSTRGRSVTLLDRPVARPPTPLPWAAWLERLADAEPEEIDLLGLLRQIGDGVAGDGTLIAVLTVPDPVELRALVRAGRGFTTRAVVLVDAASHDRSPPDAEVAGIVASLRAAGWRATSMARGDRLDACWQELVASGRVVSHSSPAPPSPTAPSASGRGR